MLNEETLFIHDLEVSKNFASHSFSFSLCFYYFIEIITHNPPVVWAKITLPIRGLKSVI